MMTTETAGVFWNPLVGRYLRARIPVFLAMLGLIAYGLVALYAVGNPRSEKLAAVADGTTASDQSDDQEGLRPDEPLNRYAGYWKRQAVFAGIGLVGWIVVNWVDYRRIGPYSYAIYGAVLALLAMLLVDKWIDLPFVPCINNARRWIRIPIGGEVLQIQPSEFCKLAFILALAWYLRFRENYRTFLGLVGPFSLTMLATALILLQPDLGTVMLLMPILFAMLFVAGARVKHLLLIVLMAIAALPFFWHFMHGYQRMRIASVLLQHPAIFKTVQQNPKLAQILVGDVDRLRTWQRDEGYHLLHSKQAIASGGWRGYGFARGPYIRYDYLPERHNDFIFAAIAHQFGLVGAVLLLALYAALIAGAMDIAWLNTEPFGRLIAAGIGAMFAVEVLVNVSMTLGLMPITGLTLPLVSYGGSSMIVHMLALGLLNNIGRNRPFSVAKKPFEFSELSR